MSWKQKFADLCQMKFTEQAHWFMNGFWQEGMQEEAETIWNVTHCFLEQHLGRKVLYGALMQDYEESCDLDEFKAHVLLEKLNEVLTVRELRGRLKQLDIDNNNRLSVLEYLLDKYKKTPQQVVDAPQGTVDQKEMDAAIAKVESASTALDQAVSDEAAAKTALAAATAAFKECERLEAPLKQANEELDAAVADLHAEEKKIADKLASLHAIAEGNGGIVSKNKAKNEIAQMKDKDPLPLQRAKITQEAALKRVEKARKPFTEATNLANAKKRASEEAAAKAVATKAAAEEAFQEAQDALEELKKSGSGGPQGAIWWMSRVLSEKKKFMPK